MANTTRSNINLAMYQRYAKRHFPSLLMPHLPNTHKGTFGTVGIAGGAVGMAGAPLLAGVAAMFTGCGKTVVAFNQPQLPMPVHAPYPELMLDIAANASKRQDVDVWAVGCGLGRDEAAIQCVQNLWHSDQPRLVLDADALHILADYPDKFCKHKHNDLVLTPHPGEAAHLLNITINQVQDYRPWVARELADRYHCWVVLKGHDTIISSARGLLHTNNTGNAGLATAGSGDVLTGIITSLLAQGLPAEEAIPAGVWLHGAASELLEQSQTGPIGLMAGELAEMVRWLRNRLTIGAV
ncbi:NAD(P)H-hydrate dehydratase [Kingella kingae]|uniref:ADP-dependent (S)-NAD(P)H-hydrate dehydratase n=2 Tax=Kingella kingae TaxID=504 RepID=F5S5W4_KINKI|nr:NAD(P)H-hydrate dehydratase [Kingella kingae]EGK10443.1 carbohydrate kinase [Kingella kingae ATCC 23330]MDK4533976.1 NAD(P)H-hydrate dehydratase [Kingella kingae]MDK4536812.1 NAD(P)H-hydrate dehydratase [Kingella kingae]MDK4539197.1 NAD(P)H-hydrate dehydratase [Kingella kingae]MDK4540400.1 NAD(P)H-hydrate dehydratase [Kingella kingae]